MRYNDALVRGSRTLPSIVVCSAFLALAACGKVAHEDDGTGALADAAAETAPNYEIRGAYRCCAKDAGTTCCEGLDAGICFQYGGIYGDCRREGEKFEAKVICSGCCEGLEKEHLLEPGNAVPPEKDGLPEGCDDVGVPSLFVCIRRGDGVCGSGENYCNSPEDCPRL